MPKEKKIARTVTLSRANSEAIDRTAKRLGVTYSTVVNLFLDGQLNLDHASQENKTPIFGG